MANIEIINRVFIALIEVKPLANCQLDPSEYIGAYVRAYIPAKTFLSALDILQQSLQEEHFALVDIDFMADEEATEWENPEDSTARHFSKKALNSGEVVYGEFHAWDGKDLH